MYFVYFSEANSLLKDIMSVFTRIPQTVISWKAPQDVPEQLGSPTPMLTFILKYTIAASWFGPKEGAVVHLFTTLALTEVSLLPWGFAQRLNPILVIPFLSCQQKVQIFTYPVKFDAHILIPFNKTLGSHFYFSSIVSFYAPDTFCSWLKSRQYCAKVMRHSSFHSRFPGKMTNKCNSLSKRLQTWMEILYKMSYNELEAQCLVWGLLFFNRA